MGSSALYKFLSYICAMQQNNELRLAWDFVEHTGTSIFLTGKAGTGKTTFLKAVKEHSSKRMIVVAPTGVAAVNANGMTIHSFFQLPLSPYIPGTTIRDRYDFRKEKRRIIRTLDMLVIDEISMVRADLLDAIDFVLRRYRDSTQPFGGVQLLMIGDLQQLTPVVKPQDEALLDNYYDTPYFFGSKALQQISYVTIQLTHVFRQQDDTFISILNHIRDGHPTSDDIATLNTRYKPAFLPKAEDGYIRLTTHNRLADNYNETALLKLKGQRFAFDAEVGGEFPENNYPVEAQLVLKVGAQVMFVKNDASGAHRYYNGRIGHVVSVDDESIEVKCPGDDSAIKVERDVWENTRYVINDQTKTIDSEVLGTFKQYPLRLAWAITIHKSQGLTFDRAIIDAAQSFAPGQVYVALSRCKSLEGLVLASPINPHNIINDTRVAAYIANQQQATEQSVAALPNLKEEYYRYQLLDMFNFAALWDAEQLVNRTLVEFFRGYPELTACHKTVIEAMKAQVMDVAYKWMGLMRGMAQPELHKDVFLERVQHSELYFLEKLKDLIPGLLEKTKEAKSQNKKALELMDDRYKELMVQYFAKTKLLEAMADETFTVSGYMQAKQEAMLDAMDLVMPDGNRKRRIRKRKTDDFPDGLGSEPKADKPKAAPKPADKPKRQKGQTFQDTYALYCKGMSIQDIATARGLAVSTITGHLFHFVREGKIRLDALISPSKIKAVRHAMAQLGPEATRTDIKNACRADITWEDISLVISASQLSEHKD